MLVEVFKVVLLNPPIEDEGDALLGGPFQVVRQDADFERSAPGIGRSDDQLAHLGLAGPGAFQNKGTGFFGGIPLVPPVVLFPSDEVIIGRLNDPSKDFMTEDPSVNDQSQKGLFGQTGLSAKDFG